MVTKLNTLNCFIESAIQQKSFIPAHYCCENYKIRKEKKNHSNNLFIEVMNKIQFLLDSQTAIDIYLFQMKIHVTSFERRDDWCMLFVFTVRPLEEIKKTASLSFPQN